MNNHLKTEDKKFLEEYELKKLHRFKEILAYCAILDKLTKQ